MIRIAVVGEIGSGKTYVAKQFGFPVFNADKEVSKIYKSNRGVYKRLKKKFPKFILTFPIKKKEVSNTIKNNTKNLKIISKLIHPTVRKEMNRFLRKNHFRKAVVLDIPLYFENNIGKKKDIVVFISAHKKHINHALKKRNQSNFKLLKKLGNLQMPANLKKKKSDYVFKNDFKSKNIKKKIKVLKNIIFN